MSFLIHSSFDFQEQRRAEADSTACNQMAPVSLSVLQSELLLRERNQDLIYCIVHTGGKQYTAMIFENVDTDEEFFTH